MFTIVALSSRERDRLFDEVIRTLGFGLEDPATSEFRQTLENNDLLAVNARFDEIAVGGHAAAPGTPWGTDEIIYECSVSIDLVGDFIADPVARELVPLASIIVTPTQDLTPVGTTPVVTPPNDGKGSWL